jgi:hypothetical protein
MASACDGAASRWTGVPQWPQKRVPSGLVPWQEVHAHVTAVSVRAGCFSAELNRTFGVLRQHQSREDVTSQVKCQIVVELPTQPPGRAGCYALFSFVETSTKRSSRSAAAPLSTEARACASPCSRSETTPATIRPAAALSRTMSR